MLATVFGEPALPDCMAGCHAQHQQTAFAKKKSHDAMFFVNTARFGVRGARPPGLHGRMPRFMRPYLACLALSAPAEWEPDPAVAGVGVFGYKPQAWKNQGTAGFLPCWHELRHHPPRCPMNSRLPKRQSRTGHDRRRVAAGGPESHLPCLASEWLGDDRLFTPLGHEPGYDYPLLVWLPESPQAATRKKPFELGKVMQRVSLRNFVAVQPVIGLHESPTTGLPAIGLDEAVWRSIERVRDRIAIHPDRIFLVGQGGGGSNAFRIACRHPREFAGVISLGGPFPLEESLFSQLADVRRLPMLLCCRRSSVMEQAAHTDRTLRLFHAAGAALAMRIYPGSNDLSKAVLADVNRWVMDEVCGKPAVVPSLSAS